MSLNVIASWLRSIQLLMQFMFQQTNGWTCHLISRTQLQFGKYEHERERERERHWHIELRTNLPDKKATSSKSGSAISILSRRQIFDPAWPPPTTDTLTGPLRWLPANIWSFWSGRVIFFPFTLNHTILAFQYRKKTKSNDLYYVTPTKRPNDWFRVLVIMFFFFSLYFLCTSPFHSLFVDYFVHRTKYSRRYQTCTWDLLWSNISI